MEIVVIGGGCYGTTQTQRLLRAMEMHAIPRSDIVVVDRNARPMAAEIVKSDMVRFVRSEWEEFLINYLRSYEHGSGMLVPAHISPHLLLNVSARLISEKAGFGWRKETLDAHFNLPFDKESNGVRYISRAAWLCPFSCIEPEMCPAIRAPRDWDLSITVAQKMDEMGIPSAVFKVVHYAWGVGTIGFDDISLAINRHADRIGREKGGKLAVATTSNCHGVVGLVEFS